MSRSNRLREELEMESDEEYLERMADQELTQIDREFRKGLKISEDVLSTPSNPALTFNPSGYRRNIDEAELGEDLAAMAEMGYEIPVPRPVVITEDVSLRSILALCDALVAHAFYKFPNLFMRDPSTTAVEITPIELKAYFFILFLNRMRAVNQITGDAVGTIPYLADDAPMPRALFECLCACAPYVEGNKKGILTLDYNFDIGISNENIVGETWVANDLSTPALLTLQGPPVSEHGVQILAKNIATGEAIRVDSSSIITTLSAFWTDDVDEDRIIFAVNQIYERTFPYSSLPQVSNTADFFACSRALDAEGRPANQLMNPFSNYDAMHATIFAYFKRCHIQTTMNQKVRMQAPTRPNDITSAAQYSPDYCFGVYVSQGDRLKIDSPVYLGSRKYYSYDGKSVNPAPMYKKVDPEIISHQATDCARSLISQLAIAMKSLAVNGGASQEEINSPKFYRSLILAFTMSIFKRVQNESLGFMTKPSSTAMPNQCLNTQLFGSIALIAKGLGPVVVGQNLVLPFFEFANDTLVEAWYNMNRLTVADPLKISKLFGSTMTWANSSSQDDEYLVEFDGHIVNQVWVDTYLALSSGQRKFPFFSANLSREYEGFLEAYSIAGGMFLPVPEPDLGDSTMLTYTKYVRDLETSVRLPVLDTENGLPETPWAFTYVLQIERLLFSDFLFGLNFSQTTVTVSSLDIFEDDAMELNEFPYANPLNILPGARSPFSVFNDDVANSNGVVQKAYAANVSKNHSKPVYILGNPVIPKTDQSHCFWSAVSSALGSIGDAVLTGVNTFIDTGNPIAGVLDAGKAIAEDVFTTSTAMYAGSPHLTVAQLDRQKSKPGLYQHTKSGKTQRSKSSKKVAAQKPKAKKKTPKVPKKGNTSTSTVSKATEKALVQKAATQKPKNPKPKRPPVPQTKKATPKVRSISASPKKMPIAKSAARTS